MGFEHLVPGLTNHRLGAPLGEEAKVRPIEDPCIRIVKTPEEQTYHDPPIAGVRKRDDNIPSRIHEVPHSEQALFRLPHVLQHIRQHDHVEGDLNLPKDVLSSTEPQMTFTPGCAVRRTSASSTSIPRHATTSLNEATAQIP